MSADRCRTYDVDGVPVVVRGSKALTEKERGYLAELVQAVQKLAEQEGPRPETGGDR